MYIYIYIYMYIYISLLQNTETVARTCFVKYVVLKILQNSQENTCAGVPLC